MKIAYFDCIGGASGDMILGALLDAGLPLTDLKKELEKLPIRGWKLTTKKVMKQDIAATSLEVHVEKQKALRNLQIIEPLIQKSSLPKIDIDRSIKIFRRLGEAEARVHRTTIDTVHFHEIGAVDTIIDIVGAVCGLRLLGIEHIVVSSLPIGKVGPAALELLRDFSIYGIEEQKETVTPTGAAILTTLAHSVIASERSERGNLMNSKADRHDLRKGLAITFLPSCTIQSIGYGAGKSDFQTRPNVSRLVIGETSDDRAINTETLVLLETNIDDANPQIYDYVMERLFKEGALDVWLTPIQMKKNRPAVTLSILCSLTDEKKLSTIVFEEGLTLGIRRQLIDRVSLPREIKTVKTKYGNIRVKIAKFNGKIVRATPEYEDCKKIAKKQNISLQEVMNEAHRRFDS